MLSTGELVRMPNGVYVLAADALLRDRGQALSLDLSSYRWKMKQELPMSLFIPIFTSERGPSSRGKFLLIEGKLQNEDAVVHIRAERVVPLAVTAAKIDSHNFY